MFNAKFSDLQTYFRQKIANPADYKKAISIALGIAVSKMIPIPSSSVDCTSNHYSINVNALVKSLVAEFNENIVVDVDLACETARSYWMIRYTCAHPDLNVPLISTGVNTDDMSFISRVNDFGRYINPDLHGFCQCNSELMIVLVNRIISVMKK